MCSWSNVAEWLRRQPANLVGRDLSLSWCDFRARVRISPLLNSIFLGVGRGIPFALRLQFHLSIHHHVKFLYPRTFDFFPMIVQFLRIPDNFYFYGIRLWPRSEVSEWLRSLTRIIVQFINFRYQMQFLRAGSSPVFTGPFGDFLPLSWKLLPRAIQCTYF